MTWMHWELKLGDRCERGSQLRPYIVWFGEAVPMIEPAIEEVATADIFAVIGTSLLVYPAAGLVQYAPPYIPKFIIDLKVPAVGNIDNLIKINKTASEGVAEMIAHLSDIKD